MTMEQICNRRRLSIAPCGQALGAGDDAGESRGHRLTIVIAAQAGNPALATVNEPSAVPARHRPFEQRPAMSRDLSGI
jgi:hypothetical protein